MPMISSTRELRGIKVLRSTRSRVASLKLTAQTGRGYFVILSRYVLGLNFSTRFYKFDERKTAEYFFQQLEEQKFTHQKIIDRQAL